MLTRPKTALWSAVACLVGLVLTGVLAELVPAAHVRDAASLHGFAALRHTHLSPVLDRISHLADADSYVILGAGLVIVALARGRKRLALVVTAVLLAAPATTELLKQLLAQPRDTWLRYGHIADASWPSGHATAAMTLALCAVMVAPRRLRPLVATAGGLFALAVAYAVLVFVHHFPSDVVGGFFVAAIFTLLAVALLRRWPDPIHETAEAEREPPSLWPAVALAATSVIAGLALAFQHPSALATHVAGHPSFVIAAAAIAALAGVLAAVLARSARG